MSCCQIMELTAWLKIAQCTGDLFSPLRGWLYRVWPLLSFFSFRGKVIGGSVIILSVGILTAEGEIYSFFIYSYISFIIYDWQKKKKQLRSQHFCIAIALSWMFWVNLWQWLFAFSSSRYSRLALYCSWIFFFFFGFKTMKNELIY